MSDLIEQTVILGGGFTGLYTALYLRRSQYPQSVILIDREECFRFRPLLYEYFSDQMDAEQVMPHFEDLLRGSGVIFVQDAVESIDLHERKVRLSSGRTCPYSHLVLALGSVTGYFGVEGAQEYALPFRDAADAIALKRYLHERLEQAIHTEDPAERRKLLTFVVIGGGPTGVELAATLADLVPNWYENLGGHRQAVQVLLLNRGPEILKGDINDPLRGTAQAELQNRAVQVEILANATATAIRPDAVEYQQDHRTQTIPTVNAFWTAGTATHPLIKDLPIPDEHRDHKGRILVKPTLQLPDFPEVFAGGDCAVIEDTALPPTAQVAHQQGDAIAKNLLAIAQGKAPKPAEVKVRGTLMKLGLEDAAANLFERFEVDGTPGHLIRQGTYMNVLPTPWHDFKITLKWFNQEIFEQHLKPKSTGQAMKWAFGAIVATMVARKILKALGNSEGKG